MNILTTLPPMKYSPKMREQQLIKSPELYIK